MRKSQKGRGRVCFKAALQFQKPSGGVGGKLGISGILDENLTLHSWIRSRILTTQP
jgi:hypothetical protein